MSIGRWVFQNGGVPTKQLLVFVGERDPEFTYVPAVSISSLICSSEREMVAERDYPPPMYLGVAPANTPQMRTLQSVQYTLQWYGPGIYFRDNPWLYACAFDCLHIHTSCTCLKESHFGNAGISVLGSYSIHHHHE